MKLHYSKPEGGNFGDAINPWLWERLLPNFFDEDESQVFVGIGTIIGDDVPGEVKVVFSSGAGYKPLPKLDNSWKIYCVRGPLTAQMLGIDPGLAVTDGAALLRTLSLPEVSKEHEIAYMPHHSSMRFNPLALYAKACGIPFISPCSNDVLSVIGEIQKTELLITEAMHGAIVADALRIPWIPFFMLEHVLEFKWQDWAQSLDIEFSPIHCFPISRYTRAGSMWRKIGNRLQPPIAFSQMKKLIREARPHLSSDAAIAEGTERLVEKWEQFRSDFAQSSL